MRSLLLALALGLLTAPAQSTSITSGVCTVCPTTSGGGSAATSAFIQEDLTSQANGVTTLFGLADAPLANSLTVTLDGLIQRPITDYSISGLSLTMVVAPAASSYSFLVDYSTGLAVGTVPAIANSTAPASGIIINSLTQIGIATATLTLNGGKPVTVYCTIDLDNSSGSKRTYTHTIREDGVVISPTWTSEVTAGKDFIWTATAFVASSVAGTRDYTLYMQSSSTNVNQTIEKLLCIVVEH